MCVAWRPELAAMASYPGLFFFDERFRHRSDELGGQARTFGSTSKAYTAHAMPQA
jgi:hypothetical protein